MLTIECVTGGGDNTIGKTVVSEDVISKRRDSTVVDNQGVQQMQYEEDMDGDKGTTGSLELVEYRFSITYVSGAESTEFITIRAPKDGQIVAVDEDDAYSAKLFKLGDFTMQFAAPPHMGLSTNIRLLVQLEDSNISPMYRIRLEGEDFYRYTTKVVFNDANCVPPLNDSVSAPCASSTPVIADTTGTSAVAVTYKGTDIELADGIVRSLSFYHTQ